MGESLGEAKGQNLRRRSRSGAARATVETQAREEVESYKAGTDQPIGGYSALLSVYAITSAAIGGALLLRRKQLPKHISAGDLALLSVATFKASRVTARDAITSPLRTPFARYAGDADSPAEVREEVRGRGLRRVVGELITCPFCLGQWVATGFIGGFLFAPRVTRVVAATFTAAAVSDALQLGYGAATKAV
jgi:hypothetical protein